jgi:hypothetical protein
VAVPGDGEVDGDAAGEAEVFVGEIKAGEAAGFETASWAVTILVMKRIAPNAIGNFFMKVVCRSSFQSFGDWLWRSDLLECQSKAAHLHKCDRVFGEFA